MTLAEKIAGVTGGSGASETNSGLRAGALVLAFVALAIVVTADCVPPFELRLSSLTMLVMIGVAWLCGPWWGGLFAFLSAFPQVQVGLTTGTTFSEPVYFHISNGNRLFAYR